MAIGQATPAIVLMTVCLFAADKMVLRVDAQTRQPLQTHLIHIDGAKPFAKPFVVVGSAHERGLVYGKQYRSEIRDFLDREIYELVFPQSMYQCE